MKLGIDGPYMDRILNQPNHWESCRLQRLVSIRFKLEMKEPMKGTELPHKFKK